VYGACAICWIIGVELRAAALTDLIHGGPARDRDGGSRAHGFSHANPEALELGGKDAGGALCVETSELSVIHDSREAHAL
jgi:hypothetical protein